MDPIKLVKEKIIKSKKRFIPLHYQKRYVANINQATFNQSLLTNLYRRKSRSLLKNNKMLAEAYQKCLCKLTSKEQHVVDSEKNANIILCSRMKLLEMADYMKKAVSSMEEILSVLICPSTSPHTVKRDLSCYLEFKNKYNQLNACKDQIKECDEIAEVETSPNFSSNMDMIVSNAKLSMPAKPKLKSADTKRKSIVSSSSKNINTSNSSMKRNKCDNYQLASFNQKSISLSKPENNQSSSINYSGCSEDNKLNNSQNGNISAKSSPRKKHALVLNSNNSFKSNKEKEIVKTKRKRPLWVESSNVLASKEKEDVCSVLDSVIKDFAEVGEKQEIGVNPFEAIHSSKSLLFPHDNKINVGNPKKADVELKDTSYVSDTGHPKQKCLDTKCGSNFESSKQPLSNTLHYYQRLSQSSLHNKSSTLPSKRRVRFSLSNLLDVSTLDIDSNTSQVRQRKSILRPPSVPTIKECLEFQKNESTTYGGDVVENRYAQNPYSDEQIVTLVDRSPLKNEPTSSKNSSNNEENITTNSNLDLSNSLKIGQHTIESFESSVCEDVSKSELDKHKERRRRSAVVSYKEPSLTKKLRRNE